MIGDGVTDGRSEGVNVDSIMSWLAWKRGRLGEEMMRDLTTLPFGGRCTAGAQMAKKHSLKQRRQGSKSNTPSSERRQQPCTGHSIIAGTVFFSIVEELSSSPRPKSRSHQTSSSVSSVHPRRIRPINSASRRHRTSHSQHHPGNHDEFERS